MNPNPGAAVETQTEVKVETKPLNGVAEAALSKLSNAVGEIVDPSHVVWTAERVALLKKQCVPEGATDDEFGIFLLQCKRTELDPLIGEAFCVPRRSNLGTREHPRWITKHVFQPSESGMSARADHFSDFQGIKAAVVYEKDEIVFDQNTGEVTHKSNPLTRGQAIGAWARVYRKDRVTPVEWCPMQDFYQDTAQWKTKAKTMIVKCARMAALRRAYPNKFGGLYSEEEIQGEEREINEAPSEPNGKTRTENVTEKVKAFNEKQKASQSTVNATPTASSSAPADPKEPTYKKIPIYKLDATELQQALAESEKWINENPMHPQAARARATMDDLQQEQKKRLDAASNDANEDAPF